jgi:hypothetical protein
MRTTLEIDDDVMQAARELARLKNQPVGRVISDLTRRGLVPQNLPSVQLERGIPVWMHGPGAVPVTNELVRSLAEDE